MPVPGTLWRVAAVAILATAGAVAAFGMILPSVAPLRLEQASVEETLAPSVFAAPAPEAFLRQERYQRGDTPARFLERLGVVEPDATRLARMRALQLLRAGATVDAQLGAEGALLSLRFLAERDRLIEITAAGEGFRATERPAKFETRTVVKSGVIRSSLFAASDAADVPDSVAIQLADVFGGDIDFYRDLRKDDRFSVVYELQTLDGRAVRAGRVLAAEFVNRGRTYRAVRYGTGYYAPDGGNLRKAFLRAPLEFSRISSGFGRRVHPLFRTWQAHQGVDYAAPSGTRVRATGDGVVEFAGERGGYGKMIVLRHQGAYSTAYAHLSRFDSSLRRGKRVAQGDIIGFVGQSGWATGPHLHYEFRVAGAARNPQSIALPAGEPVPARELEAFRAQVAPLAARLDLLTGSRFAQLE